MYMSTVSEKRTRRWYWSARHRKAIMPVSSQVSLKPKTRLRLPAVLKRSRTRLLWIVAFFLVVLVGAATILVCLQLRQDRLNDDLIAAIEARQSARAIALLKQGA